MHSAQVGDARKIARTFPESELNAALSGSRLDKASCATVFADRLQPRARALAKPATSNGLRILPRTVRRLTAARVARWLYHATRPARHSLDQPALLAALE